MKRFFLLCILASFVLSPLSLFAQQVDEGVLEDLEALQESVDHLRDDIANAQAYPPPISSQEIKTTISSIVREYEQNGFDQAILEFEYEGDTYEIDTAESYTEGLRYRLREGQGIYVQMLIQGEDVKNVFLVDVVRTPTIFILVLVFCALVILVGYWRGVQAIFGLVLTLLILFGYLVPRILNGGDPILHTVLASTVILGINMHLSHGLNRQTFAAYLATLCGLLLAVTFGSFFVYVANLSGLSSEETVLFYFQTNGLQPPAGILLAGIILGAVGVLDDIAITQSETIAELRAANASLGRKELYSRAMRVGRHHIASTVNTLVLAYAGVALPLFLLFVLTQEVGLLRFVNEEFVAEEIVRTLAGTSALILTVPIATLFATFVQGEGHTHEH